MRGVRFDDCPVGLFWYRDTLCLMTEYGKTDPDGYVRREAYICSSGEFFAGGVATVRERGDLIVHPIDYDLAVERLP